MKTTTSETSVTAEGSWTDVRRWVFSMGLSLGKEHYFQVSCNSAGAEYDTTRVTGWDLVDVDGSYAGLLMRTLDGLGATVARRYAAGDS
jgi:hypothetical protein